MSLPRAFALAMVVGIGIAGATGLIGASMPQSRAGPESRTSLRDGGYDAPRLAAGVSVTGQITVDDVRHIAASGYRTIVDFRPDGEAPGQASAATLEAAARAAGLAFIYIPTPPSTTPEPSVNRLADVLAVAEGPVILYCRVGSRASRIWALTEANRSEGASATAIAAAVRKAGHRIDDLLPDIDARIATRNPSRPETRHARYESELR